MGRRFKNDPDNSGFFTFRDARGALTFTPHMNGNTPAAAEIKLDFDTAQFLHALFGNELKNLAYLETALGVKVVTRDGWVQLSGEAAAVERAQAVFADLESARRTGGQIGGRDFRMAVDVVAAADPVGVKDLNAVKLVGSSGRKPVIPRTPAQLDYVRAIETHDVVFLIPA